MAVKRVLISFALGILVLTCGCRTWCEHHYPCQQACCPPPCAPCCPPPSGYAPYPQPPAPVSWSSPGGGFSCQCQPNGR